MSSTPGPLTPTEAEKARQVAAHHNYLVRVAIAEDQALDVIAGGHIDETISARAGRAQLAGRRLGGWAAKAINFVFGKKHCESAIVGDLERAQQVEVIESKSGALPPES